MIGSLEQTPHYQYISGLRCILVLGMSFCHDYTPSWHCWCCTTRASVGSPINCFLEK